MSMRVKVRNPWQVATWTLAIIVAAGTGILVGNHLDIGRSVTHSVSISTPRPTVKATPTISVKPRPKPSVSNNVIPSVTPSSVLAIDVYTCTGEVSEPADIVLSCGDGGSGISGITWSEWNIEEAVGYGTAYQNSCSPNCANGSMITSPVTVVLNGYTLGNPDIYEAMTVSGATGITADLNGEYELNGPGNLCNITAGGC